jgi:threonine dehydrogenase-like Zn-dependent dehydrogenase
VRAIRFDGTRLVVDTKAPTPVPAPGEALVRPLRMGISPTDLAIARGGLRPSAPLTIGHEFVGIVEQVNIPDDAPQSLRDRRSLRNARVVGTPGVVCGHCDLCRSGLSPHCRNRTVMGLAGRDGCFADRFCLPVVNLAPVPAGISDDAAVLAMALSAAAHAANVARAATKSYVAVLGNDAPTDPGAMALHPLLVAFVLSRHAPSTRLLTRSRTALEICERWGIKHRPTPEAGRRQDQDAVVECSATGSGLRLAMQFVRPRGVIVMASPVLLPPFPPGQPFPDQPGPDWARPVDLTPLVSHEVTIVCCREGPAGGGEAFHLLRRGELDIGTLITRRFRLDDGLAAIETAADPAQTRVVLEP